MALCTARTAGECGRSCRAREPVSVTDRSIAGHGPALRPYVRSHQPVRPEKEISGCMPRNQERPRRRHRGPKPEVPYAGRRWVDDGRKHLPPDGDALPAEHFASLASSKKTFTRTRACGLALHGVDRFRGWLCVIVAHKRIQQNERICMLARAVLQQNTNVHACQSEKLARNQLRVMDGSISVG
jgi:hypothetical protein